MSTIERLKDLLASYGHRPAPPVHVPTETWEALPKLLALIEAGRQMRGQFALPDESKDFPGMIAAIDFFEACKAWDKAVDSVQQ